MKYLKVFIIILILSLSTGFSVIGHDKYDPLSSKEIEDIFPDDNFRNVIKAEFNNEEITLNKLESLNGELYASGENICDLTGISYLKSIESLVLWNNNLIQLPSELISLDNIKSINLGNNYLTDDILIKKLVNKNISVNYNLNFIDNSNNQYNLSCNKEEIIINKDQVMHINDILSKSISSYEKKWEVSKDISKDINLNISTNNDNLVIIDNNCIKGVKKGDSEAYISISKTNSKKSSLTIPITVK